MTSMAGSPDGAMPGWPRLPRWAGAAWALVWAVGLVAPSAVGLNDAGHPWLSAAGLVVVVVTSVGATMDAAARAGARPPERWPLVAIQAVVTGALAADPGLPWGALPLLLAISVGSAVAARWSPWLVVVTAVAAAIIDRAEGSSWDDAGWGTGLTTLLAGLLTYAFSRLAVVIAELHRSRAELARSAVTAERLRFSRDLHDLLGHTLSVMVVKAQAARRAATSDPAETERHTADIETIGRQALAEVRQAVQGYRRTNLVDEVAGCAEALRASGIHTRVDLRHEPMSEQQEELLTWVVREGATNVLRHAREAQNVSITTLSGVGGVTIRIQDDGSGTLRPDPTGAGLAGLGERLRGSGGTLQTSRDQGGFRLDVFVPGDDPGDAA
jgi:two-component system, NarL family, sensor histidine kinase DesK